MSKERVKVTLSDAKAIAEHASQIDRIDRALANKEHPDWRVAKVSLCGLLLTIPGGEWADLLGVLRIGHVDALAVLGVEWASE